MTRKPRKQRAVEVYDPPANDLPQIFRENGRYRLGILVGKFEKECLVDFCQSSMPPVVVPYYQIHRPRQTYTIDARTDWTDQLNGEKIFTLVRLTKDGPLTWVLATFLRYEDYTTWVDVLVDGKSKILSGIIFSKKATAGKQLKEEEFTVRARLLSWPGLSFRYGGYGELFSEGNPLWNSCTVATNLGRTNNLPASPNHLARLPPDLLVKIGQQFDINQQKKFCRLSRDWSLILNSPYVGRTILITIERFHEDEPSTLEWMICSVTTPLVGHVILDCCNLENGPRWPRRRCHPSDFQHYFMTCTKLRGFTLNSMVLYNSRQSHYLCLTDFAPATYKLRIVHSWATVKLYGIPESEIYVEDVEGLINSEESFVDSVDMLGRACGMVSALSADEVHYMEILGKNRSTFFHELWCKLLGLDESGNGATNAYKLGPYATLLLRKNFIRHLKADYSNE